MIAPRATPLRVGFLHNLGCKSRTGIHFSTACRHTRSLHLLHRHANRSSSVTLSLWEESEPELDIRFETMAQSRLRVKSKCRENAENVGVDAISIRERPAEVEDRAIPGHWEGDLLSGAKNSYIATLVERHSRFAMLIKVPSKETEAVVAALSQHVRKLPVTLRRSLTWDRGLEMAKHKDFTVATDVQVYFCDPQSPWQRGSNENTNLLLRQYFPRGTDLSGYSQAQLNQVALRLNQRPRKTLGFETPASKLQASVASTV
jgi:IS30 family transposase